MGERGNQGTAAATETAGSHVGAYAEDQAATAGSHVGALAEPTAGSHVGALADNPPT